MYQDLKGKDYFFLPSIRIDFCFNFCFVYRCFSELYLISICSMSDEFTVEEESEG